MITFNRLGDNWLGNNLFQIAATISLALKNNDRYEFPLWKYQNDFNLSNCFSRTILERELDNVETYQDPNFYYYTEIQYKPNLNLNGFFTSYRYFDHYQYHIQNLLIPKKIQKTLYGYTSIHVRRGDFLLNNEYNVLNMQYYLNAIDIIKSKKYIVFSDDITWCKDNFKIDNIEFSENKSDIDDFALMCSCEHNIIANSSYSWWAAYLNKNIQKIVIAPKQWYSVDNHKAYTGDLILEQWKQI